MDTTAGSLMTGMESYRIRKPLKLAWPCLPMIRWSCTTIPIIVEMLTISSVMRMSAADGVGSPEGWLWVKLLQSISR